MSANQLLLALENPANAGCGAAPCSAWAEISVSENGGTERLETVIEIPPNAVASAKAYLLKRPLLDSGTLLRIFVANWKRGVDLSKPNTD